MIKALTFDLDDTLWPVAPALQRAEHETWCWLEANAADITSSYSLSQAAELRYQLIAHRSDLKHQISKLRIASIEQLALHCGYSQTQANKIALDAFSIFLRHRQNVQCHTGVPEMLSALKEKYTIGAISNGNADVHKTKIGEYFDFSLRAEQLDSSKPEPALFDAALGEVSNIHGAEVPANSVVHIGDSYSKDIVGAKHCGYTTVWLQLNEEGEKNARSAGSNEDGGCADIKIAHVLELPEALEALGNN